ncbi:MAG: AAA family ATPase [Promethearchaeota archaeon]
MLSTTKYDREDQTNDFLYKFEFTNFGPISKGSLIIKDFTVLYGSNNSGKSYATYAAYYILSLFNEDKLVIINNYKPSSEIKMIFKDWINSVPIEERVSIPEEIHSKILRSIFIHIFRNPDDLFREWFGCVPIKLINYNAPKFEIYCNINNRQIRFSLNKPKDKNIKNKISVSFDFKKPEILFKKISKNEKKEGFLEFRPAASREESDLIIFDQNLGVSDLLEIILNKYLEYFKSLIIKEGINFYYLPSSRSGLIMANKDFIKASIIHPYSNSKNEPPLLIKEFIYRLFIDELIEENGDLKFISSKKKGLENFEKNVFKGIIRKEEINQYYRDFYYATDSMRNRHNILQTSSLIIELMPLIIFIKYFVKQRDIIFIEAPEAHLDIKNQWALIKILVNLFRLGIKFVITTHSPFIISRIHNFILSYSLTEEERINASLEKEDYLQPKEVVFNKFDLLGSLDEKGYGSIIRNLFADKKGIDFNDFNRTLDEIGEEYHRIMNIIDNKDVEQ